MFQESETDGMNAEAGYHRMRWGFGWHVEYRKEEISNIVGNASWSQIIEGCEY